MKLFRKYVENYSILVCIAAVVFLLFLKHDQVVKKPQQPQAVKTVVTATAAPTPTITPLPSPITAAKKEDVVYDTSSSNMLYLTNAQRAAYGLSALVEIHVLDVSAYLKAQDLDMQNSFISHYDSKGRWFTGFFQDAGYYGGAAENLAQNYPTDDETMRAWMASPEHRANILERNAIYFGYAQVGRYRVAHFGGN
jgi:uncharacterized protein YkwD